MCLGSWWSLCSPVKWTYCLSPTFCLLSPWECLVDILLSSMCIGTKNKRDTGQLHLPNKQGASCELGQGLLSLLGAHVRTFVRQQSWLPAEKWILLQKTRISAQQHKQVQRAEQWNPALGIQGCGLYHTRATAATACAPFCPKIYQGRNSQTGNKIVKNKKPVCPLYGAFCKDFACLWGSSSKALPGKRIHPIL